MKPELYLILGLFLILCVFAVLFYVRKKSSSAISLEKIVGTEGKVVAEIDNLSGAVSVKGAEWSARSTGDEVIEVGKTVTIVAVEGVQLIVK